MLVGLVGIQACTHEDAHSPIHKKGERPAQVANPQVENMPGAARITYELPKSEGLLYVKAIYEIRPGVTQEAKASYYTNTIEIEGFGNTGTYEVSLYTVGRDNQESDPVVVQVSPTSPPLMKVIESVEIIEGWGGATVRLTNEHEAAMTVEVLTTDESGDLTVAETFYTQMKEANLPVRGYAPVQRVFGVVVRDHWENRSDTVYAEVVPWFEQEIDKPFTRVNLPTDFADPHSGGDGTYFLERIWDNVYTTPDFVSVPGYGLPQWFTFDLGAVTQLSRLVLFNRTSPQFVYNSGAVKRWELYGSNDPNPDGSFDESWVFLMECQSVKPSGLPAGQHTDEDIAHVAAGEEFIFPEDVPPVRYLRWKTYENWGGVQHVNIVEIDVFGQIQ